MTEVNVWSLLKRLKIQVSIFDLFFFYSIYN